MKWHIDNIENESHKKNYYKTLTYSNKCSFHRSKLKKEKKKSKKVDKSVISVS